jgi:serine/threonine protein kinase
MSQVDGSNSAQPDDAPERTAKSSGPALSPGSQIGRFLVERELGRGGMGVVYLARDTRLERPVAIKTLPAQIMDDRDVLSRWDREARLLASLNHPKIAAVYEILEESTGAGYLVLEYVPGRTLDERLQPGPVPLDDALSIFTQIAEGLEAAHRQGIVHRDLKCANIKITDDGKTKILDFGIAKSTVATPTTKDSTVTQPGLAVGTPAYMSPEQARGMLTDKRTDIWAFGCCLFEALAGRPPFGAPTSTDTVARILQGEPNWSALPHDTPPALRTLLWRCLQKDPGERLRDIGEAWYVLSHLQSGSPVSPMPDDLTAGTSRLPVARMLVGALACLLIGVLIGALVLGWPVTAPLSPGVSRLVIDEPPDKRFYLESTPHCPLALSPDGSQLVYVVDTDPGTGLCLRSMDSLDVTWIPGTEGAHNPFFSPDGRWVGFFTQSELKKVCLTGGEPVTLLEDLSWGVTRTGCWTEEGMIIFDRDPGLRQIPADGGDPVPVVEPGRWDGPFYYPQMLPGGEAVLYTQGPGPEIQAARPELNERRTVVLNASWGRYLESGHLIFIRNKTLFVAPFDLRQLAITGPAVPVPDPVRFDWGVNVAQMAVSRNGTLVYALGPRAAKKVLVWVNESGKVEPLAAPARNYWLPRLSPDGRSVVVTVTNESKEQQILLHDMARGGVTQVTTEGSNLAGLFSPDGKFVVFWSMRTNKSGLYRKALDGSTPEELLVEQRFLIPASWSSDGRYVACMTQAQETQDDIWILPVDEPNEGRPFIATPARECMPAFSPDGSLIAYVSQSSGLPQVYLRRFPEGGRTVQVSTDIGSAPRWSPDGSKLFYGFDNEMMVVSVSTEPELTVGKPELLFRSTHKKGENFGHEYDVSRDGQRFLMIQETGERQNKLVAVHNWFEELARLAPPQGD